MSLPKKFIFKHDDNTYTAELMPSCEYLITWDDKLVCGDAGNTTYNVSAVKHHVERGVWNIVKALEQ